jgi:ATP-dependent HslUV protease ATP-binding subunit HslU
VRGRETRAQQFEAPDMKMGTVEINAAYVRQRLEEVTKDEDLSKFIL